MAVIKLHNTLSGKKETFKQPFFKSFKKEVGIYSCGPTVYDRIHIGNIRAFVFPDVLRRMFELNGYKVHFVRNITDIDDKTIKRSITEKVSLKELTQKYEEAYFEDLRKMNVLPPTISPRATENIEEMVKLIEILLEKGIAYKATNGIYFSISKSKGYGKLAGLHINTTALQERIANDEYDKENPQDFALWKFWNELDGENFWNVSIGKGRPGWHIECSAMSQKYLGKTFDIHTGGIDLIFPHHTNEIAQSEAANHAPLARYWLHNGHILVDGKKMAKSANNFYTLQDIIGKGISPLGFRYWLLTAHHRTLVNFTIEAVQGAEQAMRRLVNQLSEYKKEGSLHNKYLDQFLSYTNDDLDTPKAIALVWEILKDSSLSDGDKKTTILEFDKILGLDLQKQIDSRNIEVPNEVAKLINEREEARRNKDWAKADELRNEILKAGFEIKDTESGSKLSKTD